MNSFFNLVDRLPKINILNRKIKAANRPFLNPLTEKYKKGMAINKLNQAPLVALKYKQMQFIIKINTHKVLFKGYES